MSSYHPGAEHLTPEPARPDRIEYCQQPDWDSLHSREQIQQALTDLVQGLGFDCASLIYAPVGQLPNRTPGPVYPLFSVSDDSLQWLNLWRQRNSHSEQNPLSHSLSPTWKKALQHTLPQRFRLGPQEAEQRCSAQTLADQRWLHALYQQGFQELCVTPVHLPGRRYVALSCLSRRDRPAVAAFSGAAEANLLYCVHRFAHRCLELGLMPQADSLQENGPHLSRREQQCLYWAARGKSAIETAAILQLKPETVRTYLKALLKKLQAENKPQAVAIAYETGLLGNEP